MSRDLSGLVEWRKARDLAAEIMLKAGLRRCKPCDQVLPLSEFARNRSKPGGHNYTCKNCHNTLYQPKQSAA